MCTISLARYEHANWYNEIMKILVTGGAGYIGSHAIIELQNEGHEVVVVDNLSNSSEESLRRVEKITGKPIEFHKFDLRDRQELSALFDAYTFDAVIHFAGLKAVGESVQDPLKYYSNNLDSTLVLLDIMSVRGVKKLIFSSTATVYGTPEKLPLREVSRVGFDIAHPYGQTKYMIEQILRDISMANPSFEITILRYFNPIGADASGTIGEDPNGIPNNLLPYVSQVAVGKLQKVNVFGDDYDTPDGTGIRDYIHVVDLARGHVAALNHLKPGIAAYNLCTGKGTSVLMLIEAFSKATDKEIPYAIAPRRPGDIDAYYASPEKANQELGWYAKKTIEDACLDSWRWQSQNPNGYKN